MKQLTNSILVFSLFFCAIAYGQKATGNVVNATRLQNMAPCSATISTNCVMNTNYNTGGAGNPAGVNLDLQFNSSGVFGAIHPTAGVAGFSRFNGTAWAIGDIPTGASACLDGTSVHGQIDFLFTCLLNHSFAWTGFHDISGGTLRLPEKTVATLPSAASNTGKVYVVTDGASVCDAVLGNGTTRVITRSNGTTWETPNCGGGGGGGTPAGVNLDLQFNSSGSFGAIHPTGGTAGFSRFDGSAWSVGDIPTGGSTCLDATSVHGQIDFSFTCLLSHAFTWTGYHDLSGGKLRLPEATVSALPAASSNTGKVYVITDGASTCDTVIGSGTTRVIARSNGTVYEAPNCNSGGGQSLTTADHGMWVNGQLPGANGAATYNALEPRFQGAINPYSSFKISSISVWMGSGDSGKHARLGIFDDTCTLIQQSTSTLITTAGLITFPFGTPAIVSTPFYYLGVLTDSTSASFRTGDYAATTVEAIVVNGGTTPQIFSGPTLGSLSFDSTCGTRTALSGFTYYTIAGYARP